MREVQGRYTMHTYEPAGMARFVWRRRARRLLEDVLHIPLIDRGKKKLLPLGVHITSAIILHKQQVVLVLYCTITLFTTDCLLFSVRTRPTLQVFVQYPSYMCGPWLARVS